MTAKAKELTDKEKDDRQKEAVFKTKPKVLNTNATNKFYNHFVPSDLKQETAIAFLANTTKDIKEVKSGDLGCIDDLLVSQANSLNAIFTALAAKAGTNLFSDEGNYINAGERYLKMALKAQAQCANTLRILSDHKQPKQVLLTKNANIAQNQQINNGIPQGQQTTTPTAPQLGAIHHATLDTGIKIEAIPMAQNQKNLVEVDRG